MTFSFQSMTIRTNNSERGMAKINELLKRAFTIDYESAVPAEYTKEGKAHCYLYIAIR